MTEADVPELISSFKEANKSLRKRAITLGILMLLSIGLTYMESYRLENVIELSNYQSRLDRIADLDTATFKKVIDGDNEEYFPLLDNCGQCIDHVDLFRKIQLNNYDKKIMVDDMFRINDRIEALNEDKSFGIAGFTIPIDVIAYVFFLFMLILFHDFVLVILYRDKLFRGIRRYKVPDWKLGFELFGYYSPTNNSSNRFAGFVSLIITNLFILSPFVTCLLMMNQNTNVEGLLLNILNLTCLGFIITDTIIVFYNLSRKIRFWSKLLLGNYDMPEKNLQQTWFYFLAVLGVIILMDAFVGIKADIDIKIAFFILNCLPFAGLYFALLNHQRTRSKFWRGARTTLLIFCSVWLFGIFMRNPDREYTMGNLEDIFGGFLILLAISTAIAFFYVRYFLASPEKKFRRLKLK